MSDQMMMMMMMLMIVMMMMMMMSGRPEGGQGGDPRHSVSVPDQPRLAVRAQTRHCCSGP